MEKLSATIDWLSVTAGGIYYSALLKAVGLDKGKFKTVPARYAYMYGLRYEGISIYWGGQNETTFLDLSGNGCREYETMSGFSLVELMGIIEGMTDRMNISRLDLAIDDKREDSGLSIYGLARMWRRGEVTSKTKVFKHIYGTEGETLYIGSKNSECYYRFYDKRAERINKVGADPERLPKSWNRYELQLRGNKSNKVGRMLVDGSETAGNVVKGLLKNSIHFHCPQWDALLEGVGPLKVKREKKELSLEQKRAWVMRQLPKTLAVMEDVYGQDFIEFLIAEGACKIDDALRFEMERQKEQNTMEKNQSFDPYYDLREEHFKNFGLIKDDYDVDRTDL